MINSKLHKEFFMLRDRIIELHFQKLNPQQKEAILSKDKNLLLLACPGSGKTTVLINKLFYLTKFGQIYKSDYIPWSLNVQDLSLMKKDIDNFNVENKSLSERTEYLMCQKAVNPNNIVVITFTKAAALNMKNRFLFLSKGERSPFFGTFHGLFYKILRRHCGDIKIIESNETFKIINNTLVKYLDEIGEEKVKETLNYISLFKTSGIELKDFNIDMDKGIFEECYKNYENYKLEKKLLDFDDLQLNCRKLFLDNNFILKGYKSIFKYILVDEFQDCDGVQIELLEMLNGENHLFAVGDEDQCIYGFRGSRPDCMVNFHNHFINGRKLFLATNYRSPKNIVEISKNLIENNKMRNKKEITAANILESNVNVIKSLNENNIADEIALNIEKFKNLSGIDYKDNAVLYRTNIESRSIIDSFIRKKIPFRLLDKEYNFFEHFICRDILSYLWLSIDNTDRNTFLRIINKPFRYISKVNLDKIKGSFAKEDCFEMLKDLEESAPFKLKAIDKLKKDIHYLNKISLKSAIDYIICDIGYHDYIKEYSSKFKIKIEDLEEILEEFREAAKEYNSIISFFAHIESVKEEIKNNKANLNEDSVILSTIHGVKGMEFKNVFIINCNEDNIPNINSSEKNIEEERRLFYVGITRTIENLYLCVPRVLRSKNKDQSRFLEECNLKEFNINTNNFKVGEKVIHNSFGEGTIEYIDKNEIAIDFNNSIKRRFDAMVLCNNGIITRL